MNNHPIPLPVVAHERSDGSCYLECGEPTKHHLMFEVGCNFGEATQIAWTLNDYNRIVTLLNAETTRADRNQNEMRHAQDQHRKIKGQYAALADALRTAIEYNHE